MAPVAVSASLAAGLSAMLISGWVERFFFYPDQVAYTSAAQYGIVAEDVWLKAVDGSRLHAWFLPARGITKATVLHLHGNAANISNHLPLVAWLPAQGYAVLTLDYRGYGKSSGKPSLDGVVDDAAVALEYLRTRSDVDRDRLIVLGQSLGGATALRLLARDSSGVRLGIIDSAFASYRQIAREAASSSLILAPIAPLVIGSLPSADKDPIAALNKVPVPLVFIHGTSDGVIGHDHSVQLHAAATSRKELWMVESGQHVAALGVDGPWRRRLVEVMDAAAH